MYLRVRVVPVSDVPYRVYSPVFPAEIPFRLKTKILIKYSERLAQLELPGLVISARAETQPGLKFYHVT